MKNFLKRTTAVLVLFAVFSALAFGSSSESLLNAAKESSSEVKSYERTKENTLLLKSQGELKGTTVSVQSGLKVSEDTSLIGYRDLTGTNTSLTVTLPEIGDGLYISTGATLTSINLRESSDFTLKPNLSLTKDISLKSFTDTRTDLEDRITELKAEYAYNSSMTSFENTFYQSLISILNAQLSLKKAQRSYDSSTELYEKQIKAGFITEGSLPALKSEMALESAKAALKSGASNLESLLVDFKDRYGFEYEEVTSVREADLSITDNSSLSTAVTVATLALESAKQDLEEQTGYSGTLKATASAVPSIVFDKNMKYSSATMNAAIGASYTDKNWTISAEVSDSAIDFENTIKPVLTVSGKWSNSTSTSETDRITEKRLTNTWLEKQSDLDSALATYASTVLSLKAAVNEYRQSETQNEISADYNQRTLEMTQKLCDSGLASEDSLEDALFDVECDRISALVLKLQGLILENKIKLLNL